MKKIFLLLTMLSLLFVTSCKRSSNEVWDDTKTAGRCMGRGVRSIAGKHSSESRQAKDPKDFTVLSDEEYIPIDFEEEGLYAAIPQSRLDPTSPDSPISHNDFIDADDDEELRDIFKKIHFPYNSSAIESTSDLVIIANITDYLKKNRGSCIRIEGHCDQRGPAAYNLSLGSDRSDSVRKLLADHGVSPERILTISHGKEQLLIDEENEQAYRLNRRVEFFVKK